MNILINDTAKADLFSSLFQHIKLFTEQVNITFNKDKMYLQTMDSSRVSIFEMHLPEKWFNEFKIDDDKTIILGVNANILFKVLNTRDKEQTINIQYDTDSDKLNIHFTSENKKNFDKHFAVPLVNIEEELMDIPNYESNTDITVPSSYFAGIINQMEIFGDSIEFICSEDKIQLISENGTMTVDIDVDELTCYSITEDEDDMKISFSLSRLHNICMYHKISKEMEIILTHNFPMKIIYNLDFEDAKMIFYLAPKIGDD